MTEQFFRHWLALLTAIATLCAGSSARGGDPELDWFTIETPHFRIHFHGGLEEAAQHTAALVEDIHTRLVPPLAWSPRETTDILLTDFTDSANGSASALPYNQIHLFVSAPDDMSALGDYDDWLTELLTHEHTHVLHLDNAQGITGFLNRILGKTYTRNQAQPRWILEGLAVHMESKHTSGGRLRSSQFDMYLRADVLEDNFAPLDQMNHPIRRWPGANIWYLYGSSFVDWIASVYGEDVFGLVSTDYGQNPIPWGINRSIRRATGHTYVELYEGWKRNLERRYSAQARAVQKRGVRKGVRLTHAGRVAETPRFLRCPHAESAVVYYRDDGHSLAGLYRLPLDDRGQRTGPPKFLTRANGGSLSVDADCSLYFDSSAPSRRDYQLTDLFRLSASPQLSDGWTARKRLTIGRRARDPEVSPDGRKLAYVTNRAGTTTLRLADVDSNHTLVNERRLVPSARFEQAFTPRFSPDGTRLAYAVWTQGGYRDIRVVDVATGEFVELMHDRALDQQPTWSPDGRFVLFTSDRTGIANVYAYELATKKLLQVTNVINGAYMPALSPDGRMLVYVGYTHEGFDLYAMPFAPERFLPALAYRDTRPAPSIVPRATRYPVKPYSPLPTLRPHALDIEYGPGTYGQALILQVSGRDIVGLHSLSAAITVESEQVEPQVSLNYSYDGLPAFLRTSVFHAVLPRGGYRFGDQTLRLDEVQNGVSSSLAFRVPGEFDSHRLAVSYSAIAFDRKLPIGPRGDPYSELPNEPFRGFLGVAHLGYSYSSTEAEAYSISAESGFSLSVGLDYASPETASELTLTSITARATTYFAMPWLRHHVLALAASAGSAIGSYSRGGVFFTGGFVKRELSDIIDPNLVQGAFVLRGYEPRQFVGSQYNLINAEYRFPIWYLERGISTLPFFVHTLSGAVFADFGGAFDRLDLDDPLDSYHLGVGAELWLDLLIGYTGGQALRLGIARGFDSEAPGLMTYFVAAANF